MTPAEIDLFVDRLCSFWPTTNIARNTLKNGWKHSEIIVEATTEHGKEVLEKCKSKDKFPDLRTIEKMFNQVAGIKAFDGNCKLCGNNGWLESDPAEWRGNTYRQAIRCICNGGTT